MQPLFTYLLDWFKSQTPLAQIGIIIGITQAIATFIVGLMPQKWGNNPFVKALGHYGYAKFSDAFGTWKWPGFSARDPQTPDAPSGFSDRKPPTTPTLIIMCMALLCGCSGTQTAASVGTSIRTFGHEAAKVYCAGHTYGEPLILMATAIEPAMTIPNTVANAFCANVAANEALLANEAMHVLPAGQAPLTPPTYSLGTDGFVVRVR